MLFSAFVVGTWPVCRQERKLDYPQMTRTPQLPPLRGDPDGEVGEVSNLEFCSLQACYTALAANPIPASGFAIICSKWSICQPFRS